MAVSLFNTGTEFVAYQITETRGTVADIVTVGVFLTSDASVIPAVGDFTTVQLVNGNTIPLPDLAQAGIVDILALVGPRGGDLTPDPGDYQVWTCISTADEDIIRKADTMTVL